MTQQVDIDKLSLNNYQKLNADKKALLREELAAIKAELGAMFLGNVAVPALVA